MARNVSRRTVLALLPGTLAAASTIPARKSAPLPRVGEFVRFADPTTENPVVRLTNPSSTSLLPAPSNRFVSLKDRFLIFSSNRTGASTPFQLDLRTGALHPVVPASDLLTNSLCLDSTERLLYLIDAGSLKEVSLAKRRVRTIADDVSAFSLAPASSEIAVVKGGRLYQLNANQSNTVAPAIAEDVTPHCLIRPGGTGCFFARETSAEEREFWYTPLGTGSPAQPALLAKGRISNPFWSPGGESLLFLRDVQTPNAVVSEIHEVIPETGTEQRVDPTSQFAAFSPNGDGSVFVGASRSKAQPTIILLLRSVRRELTLCEHRATHAASVSPVFSPDSRRVYFQSDHQGKSALYSVNVELLVEPT